MNTATGTHEISNTEDIIDVRDIIARIEWLEDNEDEDNVEEFKQLSAFLAELEGRGRGGDEQWRGDWYPVTLICDAHFVDAMRELVQDIGDVPRDIPSYLEIDWDATAKNLRADYASVEFDGVTYWYR